MTARDALREGAATLRGSGTPFLDASLLLASSMGIDVSSLYAAGPDPVPEEALVRYREGLSRRASGAPVAYILGRKEFWGRCFAVDGRVLVPRPETELLVESALELGDGLERERGSPPRVHEACCGSGCVAISLAAERPRWPVSASDLSPAALEVARANAASLLGVDRPGGEVGFTASDLLGAVEGPFDLVVANPPYVPSKEVDALLSCGWIEPRLALDGGPDGLEPYRALVPEAARALAPGGWLLLEADPGQAAELRSLMSAAGFADVGTRQDLAGRPRATAGRIAR